MSTITERGNAAPATNGGASTLPPSKAIVRQYYRQLTSLLPSHVRAETWYSSVIGALDKSADLANAANRNPASLMYALFDSARLGLMAGTELYYLTPRPNNRAPGGIEVLGMVGYRGDIELIYNAGHVASVVVEVVRENDSYRYRRGVDRVPLHDFKPFARNAERGDLIGVYAYGEMVSGAVSRIVELNQDDIDRAMKASPTARSSHSPWKSDPAAMWLKTGVHRLRKFVPSSAERAFTSATMRATAEAVGAAHGENTRQQLTGAGPAGQVAGPQGQLPAGGPAVVPAAEDAEQPAISYTPAPPEGDDEPFTAEQFAQPPAPEDEPEQPVDDDPADRPAAAAAPDQPAPQMVTEFAAPATRGDDPPAIKAQIGAIDTMLKRAKVDEPDRPVIASWLVARTQPAASLDRLAKPEAARVIELLTEWSDGKVLDAQLAAVLDAATAVYGRPDDGAELPKRGTKEWHEQQHPTRAPNGRIETLPVLMNGDCGICEQA